MNDLKTRVEETEEQGEGETQLVLSIAAAAALGGLGFWLYRRSSWPSWTSCPRQRKKKSSWPS